MFLDEELEKIYLEHKDNGVECSKLLIEAMCNKLREKVMEKPLPDILVKEFLVYLKQIDNSWRLFAKKHNLDPDFWREYVRYRDTEGKFIRALGW